MLRHCRSFMALPTAVTVILLAASTRHEPQNNSAFKEGVKNVLYNLTENSKKWGDNKIQSNLLSGGCPPGMMDMVRPCVQLDVNHAVKGCTRMNTKKWAKSMLPKPSFLAFECLVLKTLMKFLQSLSLCVCACMYEIKFFTRSFL